MRLTACLSALLVNVSLPVLAQNAIPADAKPTCAVTAQEFRGWRAGGDASNPVFSPPNSFQGPFDSDCAFYKWGAQMFLWLTSSADGAYVFDSPGFFDVVHTGAGSEKIATVEVFPNVPDVPNIFALRSVKPDARGGSGQAGGGGVLLSQNGALTYYGMHVNDAYVAFLEATLTAPKDFNFTDDVNAQDHLFPTTPEQIEGVVAAGLESGVIGRRPEIAALAGTLELKTSWVDASTVSNPDDFVRITAMVPNFKRVPGNDTLWPADKTQMIELAMVGMHIAGPVVGHPELVWTSYEHLGNGPIGPYLYTNADGDTVTRPYDSAGRWTFAENGAPWPKKIVENAKLNADGAIEAVKGKTISPLNAVQINPWGNAPATEANLSKITKAEIDSNTDLVSLNASLLDLLSGDANARDNYYQLGAVWTTGTLPTYQDYDVERGGLNLANSTMETFHQFGAQDPEGSFIPRNCFDCHGVSGAAGPPEYNAGTSVSHIFQGMSAYTAAR
ncbi:MAG: hypothetical protein QNJ44_01795 [Rhodobacter sp.]|nr:hypothetical protein [Rhodobacter sp.]